VDHVDPAVEDHPSEFAHDARPMPSINSYAADHVLLKCAGVPAEEMDMSDVSLIMDPFELPAPSR
jgi:hypothetical protein